MRLFEAIIEANHKAVAGDTTAGLRPAEYADALPIAALTCIDARLNPLIPEVLGIPEEHFIWLRNAGNIITGPQSSTMRSLALACAVKGAEEICIIGHTDCQVCKTSTMQLLERFKDLGVQRHLLPDNISDFFGLFGSERQNVLKACEIVRNSPLIGPKTPVHGLLIDIQTGRLEWLVNGYQQWATMSDKWNEVVKSAGETVDKLKPLADFNIGWQSYGAGAMTLWFDDVALSKTPIACQ
jgi:carbonic anhydrase